MKCLLAILFLLQTGCSLYESDARKFLREQGFEYKANNSQSLDLLADKHCQRLSIPFFDKKYDMEYSMSKSEHYIHLDFSHSLSAPQKHIHCRFSKEIDREFSESELLHIEEVVGHYLNRSTTSLDQR